MYWVVSGPQNRDGNIRFFIFSCMGILSAPPFLGDLLRAEADGVGKASPDVFGYLEGLARMAKLFAHCLCRNYGT